MKRIIFCLLCVALVLATLAPVSYAVETLEAPKICGVQTAVNATDDTRRDIRFLATVNSLRGTAVGYEVVVSYFDETGKTVTYNAADGLEGNTVYASVTAVVDGAAKQVTAAELAQDEKAVGIIPAVIRGVPSDKFLYFSVKAYVKNGEEIAESDVVSVKMNQGELMRTALFQDFNSAATPEEAGITHTIFCNGLPLSVEEGKLVIGKHSWHKNPDYYAQLVSAAGLGGATTYTLEMDVTLKELAAFTLFFNGDNAFTADAAKFSQNQVNTLAVSLCQRKAAGGYDTGAVKNPIIVNYITFNNQGAGQTTVFGDQQLKAIAGTQESVSFRLAVQVEKLADGCKVTVLIDGEKSSEHTYGAAYNATANSSVILWAQDSPATIDNLKVLDEKGNALYEQNFETAATANEAGIAPITTCTGLPMSIEDDRLVIQSHAWHTAPDYYATLATAAQVGNAATYLLEMDLTFRELQTFQLILNGDNALSSVPDTHAKNLSNAWVIGIRQYSGGYQKGVLKYPLVATHGTYASDGKALTERLRTTFKNSTELRESDSFKISVLVESKAAGCTITVYIDGIYLSSFTCDDTTYNVTANSSIILWAENTSLTVDNLCIYK